MGQLLSLLYTEIRAGIPYVFEQRKDYLTILYELFLEVYTCFEGMSEEENPVPKPEQIKEILYRYRLRETTHRGLSDNPCAVQTHTEFLL